MQSASRPADEVLFRTMRAQLFPAVIGDVLDTMGFHHQFLPPAIQPLDPAMVVIGRAMPVLEIDCPSDDTGVEPFGLMFRALDDLHPHEVYLASGGSQRYALWGELMSTRAMKLNSAGVVLNGYSRDTRGILELGFPTFSVGRYAQDQAYRGKVADFRIAIEIEGVTVRPGDIVFGDLDGVLIVPCDAEAEAIARAIEKAGKENLVRRAIQDGSSAAEAFEKYGVM